MQQKPSFKEAFLFWLKLGFISFGGPAGQISIMHEFLVEKKKWISESRFLHALNYCMLLPGPEAQQMATYMGWLLYGIRGGLVAGILFVLPSVFILLLLSVLYVTFGDLPYVYALFNGLKPAVIAIIAVALVKIGSRSLSTFFHYFFAISSFIAVFFFNIPFPLIIVSAIVIAFVFQRAGFLSPPSESLVETGSEMEKEFFINSSTVIPWAVYGKRKIFKLIIIFILLWLIPFLIIQFFVIAKSFWFSLGLFFTKAAFVTFGGAYAVLPYVAQVSVQKFHWLNSFQMIDGLALGETTPGPLIMVLAFVGFMGAYNHYNLSILHGSFGLFVTVWFTFLPCFLFIFAGAPFIEKTRNNLQLKGVLSLISASVVGVILSLTVYLFKTVVLNNPVDAGSFNWFNFLWIIISFIMLQRFKVNMILWIAISALAGLGYYAAFL
jgi:chromate transporter